MICRRPKGRRLCHTAARISVPAMRGRLQNPARTACPLPAHTPAPPRAQAPLQCAGAYKPRAHRMSSPAAHAPAPPRARKPPCNAHRRLQNPARTACPLPPRTPAPRRARKPPCNARALTNPARTACPLPPRPPAPRRARKLPCNARALTNPARTACLSRRARTSPAVTRGDCIPPVQTRFFAAALSPRPHKHAGLSISLV